MLAGERTVAAAAGAFEFGEPRTVDAKGKPGGVVGSAAVRALRAIRPRGVGVKRVFVGRDSELELLRATYRRASTQGEPHLVTIVGEPGVGKSRLVDELQAMLEEEEPAPLARTGRCLAYGAGITYWPIGEIVREHYGLAEGDSAEAVSDRLGAREILGLALGLDVAPGIFAARLDAFLALGRFDRIEPEAVELAQAGTTVEPFALRALGVARGEDELLARSDELFAALGLDWHRAQTERLLAGL